MAKSRPLEQQKTKDDYHYELLLKIEDELTSGDFSKVKLLAKAHLGAGSWEKIDKFSDLVVQLTKKDVQVSWENGGYSKLITIFNTAGLPLLVRMIKDYENKIKNASSEAAPSNICEDELPSNSSFTHELPQGCANGKKVLQDSVSPVLPPNKPPVLPHFYVVMIAGLHDGQPKQFHRDVVYLKTVLTDERIMALRTEDLIVVSPESTDPKRKLSAGNVKGAIKEIKDKINAKVLEDLDKPEKENLCFILFYSGHSDHGRLLLSDNEPLPDYEIQRLFDEMDISRKLVILDCCYSDHNQCLTAEIGSEVPDFTERKTDFDFKSSSQILQWSSSGISQRSYFDVSKLSIFTGYVLKGLCSAQTSCKEGSGTECMSCTKFIRTCQAHGCVQLFSLMEYVHDHVDEHASNKNRKQDTSTKGKFSKDLPIAHFNTSQLYFLINVKYKDKVHLIMFPRLPADVNNFKNDIIQQVRALYSSSVTTNMTVKIHSDGQDLNNMDKIKQIFQQTTTISAEISTE